MSASDTTSAVPGLLVSVRSASEALAAMAGGAALIDVKEPAHGPLGRARDAVMIEAIGVVARRCPVSAALGELIEDRGESVPAGLAFIKWGLAGYRSSKAWQSSLDARRALGPEVVAVAYADWQCAGAPPLEEVIGYVVRRSPGVVLLDTCCKDAGQVGAAPPTLLDWLRPAQIAEVCSWCRSAGVRIALAGSLGAPEVAALATTAPDWFAVRGAACDRGRDGTVSAAKVRALVNVIRTKHLQASSAG